LTLIPNQLAVYVRKNAAAQCPIQLQMMDLFFDFAYKSGFDFLLKYRWKGSKENAPNFPEQIDTHKNVVWEII
jgi:hypothetical protein